MARIVIEEPCPKCGTFSTARTDDPRHLGAFGWCDGPGGSRRVLDPGSFVLIERNEHGIWDPDTVRAFASAWILSEHDRLGGQISDGLDALAAGSEQTGGERP